MDTTFDFNSASVGGAGVRERDLTYATFTHVLPMVSYFVLPWFAPIVVAWVMWHLGKDRSDFVDDHGKECLNFQITMLIYSIATFMLMFVLVGFLLWPALIVLWLVGGILAARAGNKGRYYRYPMCLRLVR